MYLNNRTGKQPNQESAESGTAESGTAGSDSKKQNRQNSGKQNGGKLNQQLSRKSSVKFNLQNYQKTVDNSISLIYNNVCVREIRNRKAQNAIVVQLVVRHLAKVEVAGSSPVYRSYFLSLISKNITILER